MKRCRWTPPPESGLVRVIKPHEAAIRRLRNRWATLMGTSLLCAFRAHATCDHCLCDCHFH